MNALIIISCITATGHHFDPRGHYANFAQCEMWVKRFETELLLPKSAKQPLCWCHKVPGETKPALPTKKPAIRY